MRASGTRIGLFLQPRTGGALFAGWIAYRERSVPRTALWVVLIFVLGHWSTSLYVLLALASSDGDVQRFWTGEATPASREMA